MAYHRVHGVRTRIVRIFNTYGPRMRLDDGRALPNFICQALRGEDLTVFGDGSQTRSFTYVADTRLGHPQAAGIGRGRAGQHRQPAGDQHPGVRAPAHRDHRQPEPHRHAAVPAGVQGRPQGAPAGHLEGPQAPRLGAALRDPRRARPDAGVLQETDGGLMRIVAGTARGTRLDCPRGDKVRPTPEMARQALFNILRDDGDRGDGARSLRRGRHRRDRGAEPRRGVVRLRRAVATRTSCSWSATSSAAAWPDRADVLAAGCLPVRGRAGRARPFGRHRLRGPAVSAAAGARPAGPRSWRSWTNSPSGGCSSPAASSSSSTTCATRSPNPPRACAPRAGAAYGRNVFTLYEAGDAAP